jgi:hemerythrin-like domain-containing protein
MKATDLLHDDHETVDRMFDQLSTGNTGSKSRADLRDDLVRELSVHAAIEEQILYPVAREFVPAVESEILEDLEEHHVMKVLANELADLDPDDKRFAAKATVLAEVVRHHVEEEESDLFPVLEDRFSDEELEDLGESLAKAKGLAPTRPHPHGPDEPPANLLNLAAGALDRLRDQIREHVRS